MRHVASLSSARDRRSAYLAGVIVAGALALTGCGGGSGVKADAGSSVTPGSAATAATGASTPGPKTPIGKRTGDCGDAKVAVNVVVNAAADVSEDVTSIDADPTCTELILSTDLGRAAVAQAQTLCEAVANAAFANGFTTVTVRVAGQGHDAAGNIVRAIDGGPCTSV